MLFDNSINYLLTTYTLFLTNPIICEFGKEEICKYDLSELWNEYSFNIEKSLYYI